MVLVVDIVVRQIRPVLGRLALLTPQIAVCDRAAAGGRPDPIRRLGDAVLFARLRAVRADQIIERQAGEWVRLRWHFSAPHLLTG